MQNRKKHNQEIERRKRGKRRLSMTITTVVIAALVLALVWIVWDVRSRGWIMTFEGQRIATSDVYFYAAMSQEDPRDPEVRDEIIERIIEAQTIIYHAERVGIVLTDEENDMLFEFAQSSREQGLVPRSVSNARVAELMGAIQFLFPRLFDHYSSYEPEPAAFAQEFAEYLAENSSEYELDRTEVQIISIMDRETIDEVKESLGQEGAMSFEEFAIAHCIFYDPDGGMFAASILDYITWFELDAHSEELRNLQQGQTSSVIEIDEDQYILLHMYNRPGIEDSEIEDIFRERIISERNWELFEAQLASWVVSADYTLNQRAIDSL